MCTMRKVLIIQLRQLGDVLLSTPLAEAIKRYDESIQVHFLTSELAKEIVKDNPYIDKVLTLKDGIIAEIKIMLEVKKNSYDAVIDVQRTGRSKRITLLSGAERRVAFYKRGDNFYYNTPVKARSRGYTAFERLDLLSGIGITSPEKVMPHLFFSESDMLIVEEFLKKHSLGDFLVVAPAARKREKMWDPVNFGKLAERIFLLTGLRPVVVYGTESEKGIAMECADSCRASILIEKPFSIKSFAALLSRASLFIGNDSFPAHVATSQGTKSVIICGPTSGWFLENSSTMLIYKGLKCQPCNDYKSCPYDFLCYKSLSYREVFGKIKGFIG